MTVKRDHRVGGSSFTQRTESSVRGGKLLERDVGEYIKANLRDQGYVDENRRYPKLIVAGG